jgi:hypothetical protein
MKTPAGLGLGLVAALLAFGCRSEPTPYQKIGTTGEGGYSDRELSQDTFSVKFVANSDTPGRTVCRYLYRHAAEVTLKKGFRYFAVIREPQPVNLGAPTYRNEDEYQDQVRPTVAVNIETGWTLIMAIQCFNDEQKASGLHLIDAAAYLRRRGS